MCVCAFARLACSVKLSLRCHILHIDLVHFFVCVSVCVDVCVHFLALGMQRRVL